LREALIFVGVGVIDNQRKRVVRVKKERRIPEAQDVLRIFSDQRVRELAAEAKLPLGDDLRFAAGVRETALIYIGEASAASDNEIHYEVDELLRAADRAVKRPRTKMRLTRTWPSASSGFRSGRGSSLKSDLPELQP
jgi:hypothetical protein